MTKVFHGEKVKGRYFVWMNTTPFEPTRSYGLRAFSADGFCWGTRSGGSFQLSLALLLETTFEEDALKLYEVFADVYISRLPIDSWGCTDYGIHAWIKKIQAENRQLPPSIP